MTIQIGDKIYYSEEYIKKLIDDLINTLKEKNNEINNKTN